MCRCHGDQDLSAAVLVLFLFLSSLPLRGFHLLYVAFCFASPSSHLLFLHSILNFPFLLFLCFPLLACPSSSFECSISPVTLHFLFYSFPFLPFSLTSCFFSFLFFPLTMLCFSVLCVFISLLFHFLLSVFFPQS